MAHSHDRTLIASLGFADPDKQDPMHDLACEYLSQPMQAEALVRLIECGDVLSASLRYPPTHDRRRSRQKAPGIA
jgi:hypothetical protein